eukprot:6027085-Heterocapsa_arctica.AAC.1
MEYEPESAGRYCAMLSGILVPACSSDKPFLDQVLIWEKQIAEYELAAGVAIPDPIKCAILQQWAPAPVQNVFRLTPLDLGQDYNLLKTTLKTYFERGLRFDAH